MMPLTESSEESDREESVRKSQGNERPGRKTGKRGQNKMRRDKKHESKIEGETR